MEKQGKKWFVACIRMTAVLLVLTVIIMVVVDPYFHYHKPLDFLTYRLYEERYVNDGISRHFDYDAIITGTSMAQNFKTSELDALFGTHAVKEPFSGAGYRELSQNLERALQRNDNLKVVVWALDYNGLLRDSNWQKYEDYPVYLYDENPINDVSYVLNKAVLCHGAAMNVLQSLKGKSSTTMDEYASWKHETGLEHIMNAYNRNNEYIPEVMGFDAEQERIVEETIQQNIVNLVSRYPNTTFYLFYTPYSICYWDAMIREGKITCQLQAEKIATEMLLECPNVKLYNFYNQYDTVCDLNLYNDGCHYSAEVNSRILFWMREEVGLLTRGNYLGRLTEEKNFYLNYNYDSIYEEYQ